MSQVTSEQPGAFTLGLDGIQSRHFRERRGLIIRLPGRAMESLEEQESSALAQPDEVSLALISIFVWHLFPPLSHYSCGTYFHLFPPISAPISATRSGGNDAPTKTSAACSSALLSPGSVAIRRGKSFRSVD